MIKLFNDDCFDVMSKIPDHSINMILADLPYGTTKNKWDIALPLNTLWKEYKRLLAPKGVVALFGDEPFSSALRQSNKSWYRYDWYWIKGGAPTGFLNAHRMPMKKVETISIFYPKLPLYNPQMTKGKTYSTTTGSHTKNYGKFHNITIKDRDYRYPVNVLSFKKVAGKTNHPTEKPVELLQYLIKTYTNDGVTILDNTMGSGSTGVAANKLNRNFIGIELEKKYFEIAKKRIDEA